MFWFDKANSTTHIHQICQSFHENEGTLWNDALHHSDSHECNRTGCKIPQNTTYNCPCMPNTSLCSLRNEYLWQAVLLTVYVNCTEWGVGYVAAVFSKSVRGMLTKWGSIQSRDARKSARVYNLYHCRNLARTDCLTVMGAVRSWKVELLHLWFFVCCNCSRQAVHFFFPCARDTFISSHKSIFQMSASWLIFQ